MKIIKYNLCTKANYGTEEDPQIKETLSPAEILCSTQAVFDANYPIAEAEAFPGSIKVTGEFDPDAPPTEAERIAELEAALDLLLSGVTE